MKIIRASQRKFTVSVAAIVINENNEILLLDHVLRPGASWGIPGGFIEHGEQPADAVRRELYEETGIELTDVELFRVRTIYRHVEILFRAKAVGTATVKSREINAVGWFRTGEMPENMSRTQKTLVEKLLTR
jgi:mutator protein MutT